VADTRAGALAVTSALFCNVAHTTVTKRDHACVGRECTAWGRHIPDQLSCGDCACVWLVYGCLPSSRDCTGVKRSLTTLHPKRHVAKEGGQAHSTRMTSRPRQTVPCMLAPPLETFLHHASLHSTARALAEWQRAVPAPCLCTNSANTGHPLTAVTKLWKEIRLSGGA
jgi:hypothetical protein